MLKNSNKPLLPRAFNGQYPPASTFKVITALAALESGKVDAGSRYECTPYIKVGELFFHNWSKSGEGEMSVIGAIKRSCNTWFYRAALDIGISPISSMATRFGLGERSGLCLRESSGWVPTPEWWRQKYKFNMPSGELMNTCIGQGHNLITPIQDCAMMAGIARGSSVPRSRLVQQVQTLDGSIMEFFPPENKVELDLQPENLRLVRAGMKAVVEDSEGTGKAAGNSYVKVAGKTGTAQWYEDKDSGDWVHMAWFAGYMPADNPQYAFAAVYEGDPGEPGISGGKRVAPIIGDVFASIYRRKKETGDTMVAPDEYADTSKTRKSSSETASSGGGSSSGRSSSRDEDKSRKTVVRRADRAEPAAAQAEPAAEAPKREGGLRWLWKKVSGKKD
jgi:penicillin-binding protein 2